MSDAPDAPQPLPPEKWARLHQLLAFTHLTPEQHVEASDLHAQAKAFADSWHPDLEAAKTHSVAIADMGALALRQIAALIPSAAGISSIVTRFEQAIDNLKGAVFPPPQPPELPPAPEPEPAPESPPSPPEVPPTDPEPQPAPQPAAPADQADTSANALNAAEADQNAAGTPPNG